MPYIPYACKQKKQDRRGKLNKSETFVHYWKGLHANLVVNLSEITRDAFNLSRCDATNPWLQLCFISALDIHWGTIDRD